MERSKPFPTGLGTSIEDLMLERDLDKHAPYFPDFPYIVGD